MKSESPLKQILELTKAHWDSPNERDVVRKNFRKVLACKTEALGAEVYASETEEKVVYHTCKSKCCPSCGNRGTVLWQRDQWRALPDIPFMGLVLTMPDIFWPVFRANPKVQHDLPALGAAVVQQWARSRYGVELCVMVVQHTFGGHLNYNPHLHLLASSGGLKTSQAVWLPQLSFDRIEIMELWRFTVTSYLARARQHGLLNAPQVPDDLDKAICDQRRRPWNVHLTRQMSKKHFLGYAGRYIRRLPISQRRIVTVTGEGVTYRTKDTRTKSLVENHRRPEELLALISQHILGHYCHSMRYFGLLAPRTKQQTFDALFAILGQRRLPKTLRHNWAASIRKYFGVDPLLDSSGHRLRWIGSRSPASHGA